MYFLSQTQKHTLSNTNRLWNVGNRWRPVLFSFYSVHFPLGTSKENICVWNTPKVQGIIHIRAPRWKQIGNSFDFIFACLFIKDKQIYCCIHKKKRRRIKVHHRVGTICVFVCAFIIPCCLCFCVLPTVEFSPGRWLNETESTNRRNMSEHDVCVFVRVCMQSRH